MINSKYQVHILLGLISGPKSIRTIMTNRDIPFTKTTYMITALKHLLANGNIDLVSGSNETILLDNVYKFTEKVTVTEW
jgi:hypothetical protein